MQVATDSRWAPAFDGFRAPYVHVEPAHFGHLAEAAGFTVDDLPVKDLSWQFDSVDDFRDWFAVGASDWTSRLPDTEIDAFVAAVVDRYQSAVGEPALFRFGQLRASLRVP